METGAVCAGTALPGQRMLRGSAGGQLSVQQSPRDAVTAEPRCRAPTHLNSRQMGAATSSSDGKGSFYPLHYKGGTLSAKLNQRTAKTPSSPTALFPPSLLPHSLKKKSELRKTAALGLTDNVRQFRVNQRAHSNTERLEEHGPTQRPNGREEPEDKANREPNAEEGGDGAERSGPESGGERRGPGTELGPALRLAASQARTSPLLARLTASPAPPALTCCPPPAEPRRSPGPARRKPGSARGMPGAVVRQACRPRPRH